jgi:A/G-specific adenine glycosylase
MSSPLKAASPAPTATDLLVWYDRQHRKLPWRIAPKERAAGVVPDPYRIWISEIMLQQTTVAAVIAYFNAFTTRWPTVADLAGADEADVMKAWAGLGYYSRARNLKACAHQVMERFAARFPSTEADLLTLPGIGPYTAAAIAAIAFGRPALVVDGNVERVVTRLFAVETPMPEAKPLVRQHLATFSPAARPGEFAEAMMDLGATICTPTRPACALCPWISACAAAKTGLAERYPIKPAKSERPTRDGVAYVAIRTDGAILLRRRPPKGLLGAMTEVPNFGWETRQKATPAGAAPQSPPIDSDWLPVDDLVEHVFTHFRLLMSVRVARVELETQPPPEHWWSSSADLDDEALPTVMRKVILAAQKAV